MMVRFWRICAVLAFSCFAGGGCLSANSYFYPLVSHTSPLKLGAAAFEVKAFRVDFLKDNNDRSTKDLSGWHVRFLTISERGVVEGQTAFSPSTAGRFNSQEENCLSVLLYRRGYQTMQIKSGSITDREEW